MSTCIECGAERNDHDQDYSPMQVVFGHEIGWYSGDDGEICGPCMTKIIRGQS